MSWNIPKVVPVKTREKNRKRSWKTGKRLWQTAYLISHTIKTTCLITCMSPSCCQSSPYMQRYEFRQTASCRSIKSCKMSCCLSDARSDWDLGKLEGRLTLWSHYCVPSAIPVIIFCEVTGHSILLKAASAVTLVGSYTPPYVKILRCSDAHM